MANLNVVITGDKDLDRAMADFEVKYQKVGIRKATRAAAKLVNESMLELVPVDTGALAKSMKIRATKRSRKSQGHQVVSVEALASEARKKARGGLLWYAHLVEFGTVERRHKSGKFVGSMPGWPFMRNALYGNKQRVQQLIISILKNWIATYKPPTPKVKA